jgi:hypothetical protein
MNSLSHAPNLACTHNEEMLLHPCIGALLNKSVQQANKDSRDRSAPRSAMCQAQAGGATKVGGNIKNQHWRAPCDSRRLPIQGLRHVPGSLQMERPGSAARSHLLCARVARVRGHIRAHVTGLGRVDVPLLVAAGLHTQQAPGQAI